MTDGAAPFALVSIGCLIGGRAVFEADAACFAAVLTDGAAEVLALFAAALALAAFRLAASAAFSSLVRLLLALLLRAAEFLALLAAVVTVRLGVLDPRAAVFFAVFFRAAMAVLLQLLIPPPIAPRLEAPPTIKKRLVALDY